MTRTTLTMTHHSGLVNGMDLHIQMDISTTTIFNSPLIILKSFFRDGETTLLLVLLSQSMNHGGTLQLSHLRTSIENQERCFKDMLLRLFSFSMILSDMTVIFGTISSLQMTTIKLLWITTTTGLSREALIPLMQFVLKLRLKLKKQAKC